MIEDEALGSITAALGAEAHSIDDARRPPTEGGIPVVGGFYAWWARRGALIGVSGVAHPLDPALELFYVGIAPRDASSGQTLRTRVLGNHVGGNTGSSTFRFTLASLLREELGLHPIKSKTKCVLSGTENKKLSAWQTEYLALTWCKVGSPWLFEARIIEAMRPPLNLADNTSHPFHRTLAESRSAFRAAATPASTEG